MKNVKKYILIALGIILALALAFFAGGNENSNGDTVTVNHAENTEKSEEEKNKTENESGKALDENSKEAQIVTEEENSKEELSEAEAVLQKDAEPDKTPASAETLPNPQETPEIAPSNEMPDGAEQTGADNEAVKSSPALTATTEKEKSNEEYTCTLSVRCDTILNNMDNLVEAKKGFVPVDGVIFAPKEVVFYEGESVFNVLRREMKVNKIHMEFEQTPMYNSAYIEGIANLYEFDCGELSGWMYRVNGWFPNYGCSRYQLKDGDVIEWIYTCDLGGDIGGDAEQWAE